MKINQQTFSKCLMTDKSHKQPRLMPSQQALTWPAPQGNWFQSLSAADSSRDGSHLHHTQRSSFKSPYPTKGKSALGSETLPDPNKDQSQNRTPHLMKQPLWKKDQWPKAHVSRSNGLMSPIWMRGLCREGFSVGKRWEHGGLGLRFINNFPLFHPPSSLSLSSQGDLHKSQHNRTFVIIIITVIILVHMLTDASERVTC